MNVQAMTIGVIVISFFTTCYESQKQPMEDTQEYRYVRACMHACTHMHICMHVCMHAHAHMNLRAWACMHTAIVCMCSCLEVRGMV